MVGGCILWELWLSFVFWFVLLICCWFNVWLVGVDFMCLMLLRGVWFGLVFCVCLLLLGVVDLLCWCMVVGLLALLGLG